MKKTATLNLKNYENSFILLSHYERKSKLDLQQKSGQLIARFKPLHFGYTFLFQIH